MRCVALLLISCMSSVMYAKPPRHIPNELVEQFTLNHRIPVFDWYLDDTHSQTKTTLPNGSIVSVFKKKTIDAYIKQVKQNKANYYGETDIWLYQAFKQYPIQGKKVGIIGSDRPWYEAVVLAYGGIPVTIEYTPIITDDTRLRTMTVEEFNQNPERFDIILSISSIEHDGLGRYGDPINPQADLETMKKLKEYLKPDGLMFLAVPIGKDCLCWNAHRIYGPIRFPLLTEAWELIDSFGFKNKGFSGFLKDSYQPVFCLKPKQ